MCSKDNLFAASITDRSAGKCLRIDSAFSAVYPNVIEVSADETIDKFGGYVISTGANTITLDAIEETTQAVTVRSLSGTATVQGTGDLIEGLATLSVAAGQSNTLIPYSGGWLIV